MTEKFKIINNAGDYHLMNGDEELCYDLCSPTMMPDNWNKVVDKLNKQDERIKELEKENKNQNNILEDFMVMLNRLQAEPNNKSLQSMAKDMLRMMGKDIMGDSE